MRLNSLSSSATSKDGPFVGGGVEPCFQSFGCELRSNHLSGRWAWFGYRGSREVRLGGREVEPGIKESDESVWAVRPGSDLGRRGRNILETDQ